MVIIILKWEWFPGGKAVLIKGNKSQNKFIEFISEEYFVFLSSLFSKMNFGARKHLKHLFYNFRYPGVYASVPADMHFIRKNIKGDTCDIP